MADSIAGSLDGASEAELTAAPPPGRRALAALAVVLMVPIGILPYLLN